MQVVTVVKVVDLIPEKIFGCEKKGRDGQFMLRRLARNAESIFHL